MSYDADEAIRKMRESSYGRKGGNWVNNLLASISNARLVPEQEITTYKYQNITSKRLYTLLMIAAGYSAAAIAKEEGVAREVVQERIRAVQIILGAKNRTHAVAIAIRKGII